MKNRKYIYLILLFATTVSIMMPSCKKDFSEINTNPNTSAFALPQALLAPAITDVVVANMSRSQRITNELMQVTVNMGDTEGKIFRYEVRTAEADYLWNSWYTELTNFKDIYKGGEDNLNTSYQALSLIWQAYTYSLLTDTYGDIPFLNSNKAKEGIYTPNFDQQKDIYPALFLMLEQANEFLKVGNATGNAITSASDPIYAGNRDKWRRFGNSLYLRLLLRVSGKAETNAIAKIKEIVDTKASTYPIMASNDDSAVLRWSGTGAYVSPFVPWRDGDWYGPKLASFFVDNLNERSDPRIQKWASLYQGDYQGIPSGYPSGQAPEGKSAFPVSLKAEPLLGNIMNYSELQFILAEAAVKGWITAKTPQVYYEAGATSGITFWGYTLPANYLTFDKVKWDNNYTLDQKMELIHIQKYYALFFTDLQQWFEFRRTGHPVLPKGAGLNNGGVMPARLNYPVYVQSANGENYKAAVAVQGADNINTLVWWQRP
ncbi:SusD/RagB family nutrient-binding outer membrane lipoprotein [Sphingobacteriaceae bacterium GW460-11-11-14-LB5]|nr:SusD/RagB family nutrient-binding outer membrane lipoprotein [Sphingobacteriaceae bacterium GW460-11-11-14-LB5]